MYCHKCGARLGEDALFCQSCGAKVDETPLSAAAPTSETKAAKKRTEQAKTSKKTPVIIALVVAFVVIVGAIVGVNLKMAADAEALRVETVQMQESWQKKVDSITVEAVDRATMLASYNSLSALESSIASAHSDGSLKLSNGEECDLSEVESSVTSKKETIRDWFAGDYENRIAASQLPADASADTISRDQAQAIADTLDAIVTDMENEKVIWGDNASQAATSGTTYDSLVSRIEGQRQAAAIILVQIDEAEKASAVNEFQARLNAITATYTGRLGEINSASSARQLQNKFFQEYYDLIDDIANYASENCSPSTQSTIDSLKNGIQNALRSDYEINNTKGMLSSMNSIVQNMINLL